MTFALTSSKLLNTIKIRRVEVIVIIWKVLILSLVTAAWAVDNVTITEPVDGATYDGDWLTVRAIVENDNELPDSVHHTLNGEPFILIPRLNTDWYTYMANDLHTGFSESPAPTDNTILWTAPVTGNTHEFCSPVIVDGIVYFVSDEQSIAFALDAATGDIIWQYDVVNHVDDAVTWYEERVYVAADSAWCFDALTGERIWAFKPSSFYKMNGTPALGNGVAYFSFAPDGSSLQVYALDAENGEQIWLIDIPFYSTGCITLHGNRLYVPTSFGKLYALDISDGAIVWENSDSPSGYWDSSPVVVDSVIYICGRDGIARGIDSATGTTLWAEEITAGVHYIAATPAYAYGELFFADQVDSFHCLDALTGIPIWSVPGVQHGSSGIADGIVFYGEGADRAYGKVVALSCESGDEIWSYQTGGTEIFSSPAITDGVVYIAGMDSNLYAFGTGLKYTFLDDLFAQVGANELIVTSFDEGVAVTADTINFIVTGTGINLGSSYLLSLCTSPNPFSSSLSIAYNLPEPALVELSVYDISGRLVVDLVSSTLTGGDHISIWNPDPSLPDGCYLIVLDACGERAVRRCVKL